MSVYCLKICLFAFEIVKKGDLSKWEEMGANIYFASALSRSLSRRSRPRAKVSRSRSGRLLLFLLLIVGFYGLTGSWSRGGYSIAVIATKKNGNACRLRP